MPDQELKYVTFIMPMMMGLMMTEDIRNMEVRKMTESRRRNHQVRKVDVRC